MINYALNQKEITDLFCINKDKPEMKCNGQCHLMQELNKTDSPVDNPEQESNFVEYKLSAFVLDDCKITPFLTSAYLQKKEIIPFQLGNPKSASSSIFQPPRHV